MGVNCPYMRRRDGSNFQGVLGRFFICSAGSLIFFLLSSGAVAGDRIVYDPSGAERTNVPVVRVDGCRVGGIVPKMAESPRPLELLNPFADKSFGWGIDTVSWDRRTAKPKGFILFSALFW